LLVRVHGWTPAQIGTTMGIQMLVSGISATIITGWFVGHLRKKGRPDAVLRSMLLGACLMIIPAVLAWRMESPMLVVLMYGWQFFAQCFAHNLIGAAICDVAPNQWRGSLAAISLLGTTVVGLMVGPPGVAFLSQYFYAGSIPLALSTFGAILVPLGALFFLIGLKPFRRAVEQATWAN